jgi:hypothetical protein
MLLIDTISNYIFPSDAVPGSPLRGEQDQENSTLRKIAACIPILGLIVCQTQVQSINGKLEKLALPKSVRPHSILGNLLDKNATAEEIKVACERAVQLENIERDYTKASLVNNVLTVALAVYALATHVIPFAVGAIFIGGFSLTSATFVFILCTDHSIKTRLATSLV